MTRRAPHLPFTLVCALAAYVGGCARSAGVRSDHSDLPSARAMIPADRYAAAFDAAKTTLRDLGFLLERVDAQGGVIATKARGSAGIVAPWDPAQSGLDQEFEDAAQRQQRAVRVEFVPRGGRGEEVRPDDLRIAVAPTEARITVTIYRINLDGLRINTRSIAHSTYAINTDLESRAMIYYPVAIRQDTRLADRIAAKIAERIGVTVVSASDAVPHQIERETQREVWTPGTRGIDPARP